MVKNDFPEVSSYPSSRGDGQIYSIQPNESMSLTIMLGGLFSDFFSRVICCLLTLNLIQDNCFLSKVHMACGNSPCMVTLVNYKILSCNTKLSCSRKAKTILLSGSQVPMKILDSLHLLFYLY